MIGRASEEKTLNRLYNSGRAEFVAIYGRRRVGKTFLVDETFSGRITFRHLRQMKRQKDCCRHSWNIFTILWYCRGWNRAKNQGIG